MANLTRTHRWERFAPDLGDNLELPEKERLELEVASGLSRAQLVDFADALRAAAEEVSPTRTYAAALADKLAPYVRLVGSHVIGERPVTTLAEYVAVVVDMAGIYNLRELVDLVTRFNSIDETSRLFTQRRSGGSPTTQGRSVVKASEPTAGP